MPGKPCRIGCSKLMTCGCLASGAGSPVEHRTSRTTTNNNLLVTSSATILEHVSLEG